MTATPLADEAALRSVALIRCNALGGRERLLRNRLRSFFGGDVRFVFENIGGQAEIPQALKPCTVEMSLARLQDLGLPVVRDAGWRCGDYFYYTARRFLEERFDFYWLIESDVVINFEDQSTFFRAFASSRADLLAPRFGPRGSNWAWTDRMRSFIPAPAMGCLFPITRLSGRAIDHLLARRAALRLEDDSRQTQARFPNDEVFVSTVLSMDGFSCRDFAEVAPPEWFSPDSFSSANPIMPQELALPQRQDRVVHPVRDRAGAAGKLRRMRDSHPERYARKKNFVTSVLGAEAWRAWSGEAGAPGTSRPPDS